jgi:hypothetical protein
LKKILLLLSISLAVLGCKSSEKNQNLMQDKVNQYARFKLTADLSGLSTEEKEMLKYFFQTAQIMDDLFWEQAYGNKHELLDTCTDESIRNYLLINYGPWERLNGNSPFLSGFKEKPKGANFYPADMTESEFLLLEDSTKNSQYSILRRNDEGKLIVIPYHIAYKDKLQRASELIMKAAAICPDSAFKKYLTLRAEALITDIYQPSDMAWMDMKDNKLDFVVGPIENYEDQLFGYKTAFESYILLKDKQWSEKLNRFSELLPELQKKLPVADKFKKESPGSNSDLAAYEILYYAGDCNAGSKTIAINLPNDEEVQLEKGSRRLQLKNSIKAKFDQILLPIAKELIDSAQLSNVKFDAFFEDIMFHEVAHGLGIKNTLNNSGTVRAALKDQYSALEEGKADILGLFLIYQLNEMDEIQVDMMDHYTTFLTGIFRSIRFGSTSAHGIANLVRFNYFLEKEAFTRNEEGKYSVNAAKMQEAVYSLSNEIIVIQGNGNYAAAKQMVKKYGAINPDLAKDLERINNIGIPLDIVFEQGPEVAGID